jgi:hypothetical protein
MQSWVDRYPILFILGNLFFTYLLVSFGVRWWSGWALLSRKFRFPSKFTGSKWRLQSGQMRWICGYRGCLTIGANSDGLYLATLPFFPLLHPPLFIPWNEISVANTPLLFEAGTRFRLGRELSLPLWVRKRLAERLKGAAGNGYPIEALG